MWDVEIAHIRLEEANRGGYPDAEYTQLFGLVNRARGGLIDSKRGKGDFLFSPDEETDFLDGLGPFTKLNLEIKLPIYTFGKISAGKRAAAKGLVPSNAAAS